MTNTYLDGLEILDTYVQNDYQKISICKHVETNALYLLNSITDKVAVADVDFDNLKNSLKTIKKISETDETIDIITEYIKNDCLKDYVTSNRMTLVSQINFTSYIMDKLISLKNQPSKIFISMFDYNNLQVDDNGNIGSIGVLLLDPTYINMGIEEVLRSLANVLHIIFSGKEIEGNKALREIPPDISRLITNCLENKYIRLIDLVSDYKSTNLYRLINPEKQESSKVHSMRKNLSRKRFKYKIKSTIIIISILLIPIIAFAVDKIIDAINSDNNTIIESNVDYVNEIKENDKLMTDDTKNLDSNQDYAEIVSEDDSVEDIFAFFNEDMNLDNEDNIGIIDSEKFYKGTSSIKVSNQLSESQSFLVGYIDLNNDEFSFLKDRVLNTSLWLNSNKNIECSIVLKLGSNEKILTYTLKKLKTVQNNWILQNIELNCKNGDYIKIYITIPSNEEVWIDSIEVDILK